jgi:hypothetical protein
VQIDQTGTAAVVRSSRYFGRDTELTLEVLTDGASLLVRSRTRVPPASREVGVRVEGAVSFFCDPGMNSGSLATLRGEPVRSGA